MGKSKGKTNNNLKRQKFIRQLVIVASVVALFWAWMLYITRPATEENTYRCQVKIADAVVDTDGRSWGSDLYNVYVYADDSCYVVYRHSGNWKSAEALAQQFAAETEEVSLMVWKRPLHIVGIFDYMYYHPKSQFYDLQIVEAKCGDTVLWSLETHNTYQHRQRIAGCIAGTIITILAGGWELMNWKIFYPRRNKKKQKRSEAS